MTDTKLSEDLRLTLEIIEYKSMLQHALDNDLWHCQKCKDNGIIYVAGSDEDQYCDCEIGREERRLAGK